jgi:hypothetical protein
VSNTCSRKISSPDSSTSAAGTVAAIFEAPTLRIAAYRRRAETMPRPCCTAIVTGIALEKLRISARKIGYPAGLA